MFIIWMSVEFLSWHMRACGQNGYCAGLQIRTLWVSHPLEHQYFKFNWLKKRSLIWYMLNKVIYVMSVMSVCFYNPLAYMCILHMNFYTWITCVKHILQVFYTHITGVWITCVIYLKHHTSITCILHTLYTYGPFPDVAHYRYFNIT